MKIFAPQDKVIANVDRAIEHLETGSTSPVLVEFDPSNSCNHSCHFCLSGHIHLPESKGFPTFNRNMLSRDLMMRTCEELIDMKVRAVNWTGGGEPTANPALKECIEYLGKNGVKMGMFTNGTLLHTFDLFDTLLEYMTWVRISIDAGDPDTYNSIRRTVKGKNDWNRALENLLILLNKRSNKRTNWWSTHDELAVYPMGRGTKEKSWHPNQMDIGVGFVITPDTYNGIVDFAEWFRDSDVDYCQYKPEIVNVEREGGIQRQAKFWKEKVNPLLDEARDILGDKFQMNGYHFEDLENDPKLLGRTYEKCLGSQISPCIGADGEVYVCPNHRGHERYSYGSLHKQTFKQIWNDINKRKKVMSIIEDEEQFSKCTQLCKPHESNKMLWSIKKNLNNKEAINDLKNKSKEIGKSLIHKNFI